VIFANSRPIERPIETYWDTQRNEGEKQSIFTRFSEKSRTC